MYSMSVLPCVFLNNKDLNRRKLGFLYEFFWGCLMVMVLVSR